MKLSVRENIVCLVEEGKAREGAVRQSSGPQQTDMSRPVGELSGVVNRTGGCDISCKQLEKKNPV